MPSTFVSCAAESDNAGVFSFAALHRGYHGCRRRKRGTANAQRYELRLLDNLVDTATALQDRTYAPSRSLCFIAHQPKAREIHAADFSDRVVHHVLVPRLEALFEPVFIHDLYSNRKGKGTEAVERLAAFMRSVGDNGRRPAWFLQLDVRNFFNSIDQAVLFGFINQRLKKAVAAGLIESAEAWDLSWLTRVLLKQDLKNETLYRCTQGDLNHYRLVRRRVVGNLRDRLTAFARTHVSAVSLRLPPERREALRAVLASYLGHFGHADSFNLVQSLFAEFPWLGRLFALRRRALRHVSRRTGYAPSTAAGRGIRPVPNVYSVAGRWCEPTGPEKTVRTGRMPGPVWGIK